MIMQGDFAELAADVLDKDEAAEALKHRAKTAKPREKPKPPAEFSSSSKSQASSPITAVPASAASDEQPAEPSTPCLAAVRVVTYRGSWTPATAKEYLPPGASITRDNMVQFRWQVFCPWIEHPPKSTSLRYGRSGNTSMQMASLIPCLKWAWARYIESNPKTECPYDFDAQFNVGLD